MKIYQQITGYNESVIDLTVRVEDSHSFFSIAGGLGFVSGGTTGLNQTGFVFSGQNGYLFDQSGKFFGGYRPNTPFTISVYSHLGNRVSYYYNGKIIKNNIERACDLDYIEFDKNDADLLVSVKGDSLDRDGFLHFSGQLLVFSGNFLSYP